MSWLSELDETKGHPQSITNSDKQEYTKLFLSQNKCKLKFNSIVNLFASISKDLVNISITVYKL